MIRKIYDQLKNEPITDTHRKQFKSRDWEIIEKFISDTESMTANDRQIKLNRLFIDQPNKPKNWTGILEFLQFINSRIYRKENQR